jgi:curved DNA-binding protein CbpA
VAEDSKNYYQLLALQPGCSSTEIRRAYWEKSKLYHPDTTTLAKDVATAQFQQLNQAYAILSNPEQRQRYDERLQRQAQLAETPNGPKSRKAKVFTNSAYLDPGERPLSSGEIFALFLLGLTFCICLLVAVAVGWHRGELALQTLNQPEPSAAPRWLAPAIPTPKAVKPSPPQGRQPHPPANSSKI